MNFILGKKSRMTQIFNADGLFVPATEIIAEPSTVLSIKTKEKDGYQAVVLGYGKRNKVKKSLLGLFKNFGKFKYVKEFRLDENQEISLKPGDQLGVNTFTVGEKVKVTSISKGKGFQGVVKRHGFSGTDEQHGNKDQSRMPGSIGATGPAHVFKGTKMAGRMGGRKVTISNLEVVKINLEENKIYIKGAFAGAENSLVLIRGNNELKVYEKESKTEEQKEEKKEEPKDKGTEEQKPKTEEPKEEKVESSSDKSSDDKEVKAKEKVEEKKEEQKNDASPEDPVKEEKIGEKKEKLEEPKNENKE